MPSQPEELRERTKQFAIRIVKLFRALPKTEEARVLGKQVLRSGTSVAANYRAVCRSRSREDAFQNRPIAKWLNRPMQSPDHLDAPMQVR